MQQANTQSQTTEGHADYLVVFAGTEFDPQQCATRGEVITTIWENVVDGGAELSYVLEVEQLDGGIRRGHDRTEEFYKLLSGREHDRLTDRFDAGGHDFASLDGFLEVQEWHFPPERIERKQVAWVERFAKRGNIVPVEGGGAVIIPEAAE